jgi:hypothetical protein
VVYDIGDNEIRCGFPERSSRPRGDKMVRLHAAVKVIAIRQNWLDVEVVEIWFLTIIPSPGLYSFMMTWLGALWADWSNAPVAARRSIMFGLERVFVMIPLSVIFC